MCKRTCSALKRSFIVVAVLLLFVLDCGNRFPFMRSFWFSFPKSSSAAATEQDSPTCTEARLAFDKKEKQRTRFIVFHQHLLREQCMCTFCWIKWNKLPFPELSALD